MKNNVYTFILDLNWELINLISQIDRFDASWTSIERREGQTLKHLKTIATVRSVGFIQEVSHNLSLCPNKK